jgi:ubiquinone/menaquinone biosynthesis C-methylase UbiE
VEGPAAYGRFDPWQGVSEADMEQARELAARLELRARAEDDVAARAAYLDLLGIAPGERVLDVGCGSGVVTRELARRVAPDGLAVGLDPGPTLLAVARELAEQAGLAERIEWREGDARSLPFADAEFDAVLAATVLSHVPEGERAIPELARVVRPGGRVGIFDRDPDSFIIAHPDRALTRRIVAVYSDQASIDPWLARRLPGLMPEAGLQDVRVRAFATLEQGPSTYYAMQAERAAEVAAEVGAISDEERRRWLDALHAEQAAGRFLAGRTHLFVWGIRPLVMLVADDAEALAVEPATVAEEPLVSAVATETVAPVEVVER